MNVGIRYRLVSLSLMLNVNVLWNTIYMDEVIQQLTCKDYSVQDKDVENLRSRYGKSNLFAF
ncbi:Tn3 family transposase [Klebsiella oxytoca]|uniref:Tn3 family transposase n=1 Tax=Klebsiella oxytoca TaxID=571 RepID=UPI001CCCAA1D